MQVTIDDPGVLTKPWVINRSTTLEPGFEMTEYVCNENNKNREHWVGTAADEKKLEVKVAPAVLAKPASIQMKAPSARPGPSPTAAGAAGSARRI